MAIKYSSIERLENEFKSLKKNNQDVIYRITETPCWYNIQIEYDGGEEIAYYQTSNWSEIVDFCENHCNPGNDFMYGLGCTDPELIEATTKYIHGLGKKLWYES
jgi:hypothetical protein